MPNEQAQQVVVRIDGVEYVVEGRVAEFISQIVQRAGRLRHGTKIVKAALRGHDVKITVEEDL